MPGKFNNAYRRALREKKGLVAKEIEVSGQTWTDLKTAIDRLGPKKKLSMNAAIEKGMKFVLRTLK